ncbi:aldo/keto reductase [Jiangella alkaliphila]|uniref:Predicted oxidoreductase n=1 Tax=Jiangella alkaliphila TaxID=419479 RepID=A0A1H2HYM0_9ACTN|nr:aldo/keto reductase [Jiangella alkaliphila]SDU37010.1 Predicted oxidoreductase [Jiangella alkaliphila]
MLYTRLGTSGLVVSRLTFGAMTFGSYEVGNGFRADVGQRDADRMVGVALDAGVTVFDTAEAYGNGASEEVLGAALARSGARDRVVVATKVFNGPGPDVNGSALSYRHVVNNAEAALRRLGTDWIDLYQLHLPDFHTPLDETLRALDDLVRRGLVRYTGWSNFPAWYAAQARAVQERAGWAPFVSGQLYYSLVGRDAEDELLPYTRAAGLGTLIWSPLASGFLTGKYTRADPSGGGGRRRDFAVPPVDLERGYDVVDALRELAGEHGVTPAQVAYGWLLARPGVSSLIVGASSPEQLAENLAAADFVLPAGDVARLDALTTPAPRYPAWAVPAGDPAEVPR